jgi:hypothetical protein
MWTIEIVKARFFEAADVERRMMVKGIGGGGTAWPAYSYDAEDMKGWDDVAIADNLERWQGRKVTKSPEITRWEEVFFEWTAMVPERRRVLVWRWSQCIASGRSFSKYCEDKGLNRATAYNRMERVFEDLNARFRNEVRLLRHPDEKWSGQFEPDPASISSKMDAPVARRHHPKSNKLNFRNEASHDTLTTPTAVAEFAKHLADTNEARRRARLRKALRGVPGEQEAA